MKNIKRINIVDLIFLVLLVLVVAFGAYKLSDVNSVTESNVLVKATYIVEVPEETPEILNHLKVGDKVYEDDTIDGCPTWEKSESALHKESDRFFIC